MRKGLTGYKRPEVTGIKSGKYKHGHSGYTKSSTYRSWIMMKARCLYPNYKSYADYGGRGIKICEGWLDFSSFLADMGERPLGTKLDRIDVNGEYCKKNCRWATEKIQQRNRRNNRILTLNDESLCATEWAERLNVRVSLIFNRINYGWTDEKILTTPVRPYKQYAN